MNQKIKHSTSPFDTVEEAIAKVSDGQLIIVTDDETRENEGDLVMAASKASAETINMMIQFGGGLICVPTIRHQLTRLGINQMVSENRENQGTDFTVSVDAAEGITTGISAYDRALTIRLLADPNATPEALVQPGHIFPLRSRPGGVLQRAGHTEAAVDLATLAGLHPSGVICEILNKDGSVARLPDLVEFKKKHGLVMISIAQLIEYRHQREKLIERVGQREVETDFGTFELHVFRSILDGRIHYALCKGNLDKEPTAVRVQGENILSDVLGAGKRKSLIPAAMEYINNEGKGALVYIEEPYGGLSFDPKTGALSSRSDWSRKTMDFRDYGIGAQVLRELGLQKIRLLTSKPRKVIALEGYNLEIVEQIQI